MAASQKVQVILTKYFMCINRRHYVICLQNIKFVQSILWPGGVYTDATHANKAKIMIPYSDEIMNHDYIGSLGCIPNEPKITQWFLSELRLHFNTRSQWSASREIVGIRQTVQIISAQIYSSLLYSPNVSDLCVEQKNAATISWGSKDQMGWDARQNIRTIRQTWINITTK